MRVFAVREILILLGLALLPGIAQALYFRDKISWQTPVPLSELVTVTQAQSWGEMALWVDARPDSEFAREHVPGAMQLNEDRWNELLPQMLAAWSPKKRVVIYCSSQSCGASREVAQRLRADASLPNVFVLAGGWEEWLKTKK